MNKREASSNKAAPRMQLFCSYCGTKLDPGAKFCKNCGEAIVHSQVDTDNAGSYKESPPERLTQRETVYEGYIHKCPNCGEVLESFVTNCPACGYEIRDTRAADSVREFTAKLAQIESQKTPVFEEKKSVMKMVFGRDFKETDETERARRRFEEQKQQEKANLIINYPLPNTKEDILEFMLLVSSNIDTKHDIDDIETKAWIAKLEQVYQKAALSIKNEADFAQIEEIYAKKQQQIEAKKLHDVLSIVGIFSLMFVPCIVIMGMLWNPAATIAIAICVVALLAIVYILYTNKS